VEEKSEIARRLVRLGIEEILKKVSRSLLTIILLADLCVSKY
jgi:hypothetical protein